MNNSDPLLSDWLPAFFSRWPDLSTVTSEPQQTHVPDTGQLAAFFQQSAEPLKAALHPALSFNPWDIAGISRTEIRNSAILAWLLTPDGSHGFGGRPLRAFLQLIRDADRRHNDTADFPADPGRYCRIETETNPSGDNRNRVDIEIDAETFLLLIEVKIDAAEQDQQLARYCEEAGSKAASRPRKVVFLTPDGRQPMTAGAQYRRSDIPCLSWRQIATEMELSLHGDYRALIQERDASPMRLLAAHSVFCFLDHIRSF